MSQSEPDYTSKLYEVAVARDTANLMDLDAALAMSRATLRALKALSPQADQLTRYFIEKEFSALLETCTEESQGAAAIISEFL